LSGKETILVTGASGFIGRNVAEYFRNRYEVLAPGHGELDLLSQDAVDGFFRDHRVDCVIHCSNVGGTRKSAGVQDAVQKNLRMFFNLCRNSDRFGKMIYFGSGAEYDRARMPPRVSEKDFGARVPVDDYGFSKYVMSRYAENADGVYCLRLFGVFGPYEDYEYRFISNAILKNILHMPITIMQNVYFDWLYVKDLMPIVEHFVRNRPAEKTYNVTTGRTTDLLSIAGMINACSDYRSDVRVVNPGLNAEYSGSNARLLREIGNFEFTPLGDAIAGLIGYYRERPGTIDRDVIRQDPYAAGCKVSRPGT
jgi:GDP-L-fucose synthase